MHLSIWLLGLLLTLNGPSVQTTGWQYQETAEPSAGTTYKASLNATNLIQLPYPYAGGSVVTLTIRTRSGTTTAYLSVSKGLLAPSFQGGKALIRFDAGKPVTYALSAAANGRGNLLFFDDAQRLIRQLRSSKTLTLELKVIGQNVNEVTFPLAGLNWNH